MKKNKILLFLPLLFSLVLISSCNEFLDELPDNRTELDNKDKIKKLLVSAYPSNNYSIITEVSSDNVEDSGESNPNTTRFYEQLYFWKDVTENPNDGTRYLWESCYKAIANSNQALKAIEELGGDDLNAEKGEALITRAYAHFILVNVFSLHYNTITSSIDLGIPYLKKPETRLNPKYKRGNVADVYKYINEDIEKALPLIDNSIYKIPSYHFNKRAAYAFAARFNLFYEKWDKAEKYANLVLTSNPASVLRDWDAISNLPQTFTPIANAYIDSPSNLLIQVYNSSMGLYFGPYYEGSRFNHTNILAKSQTLFVAMPWGNAQDVARSFRVRPFTLSTTNFDKTLLQKIPYRFEYTDPVAQIGFSKAILVRFSTAETLLVRAEARAILNKFDLALEDVNIWTRNFYKNKSTTISEVNTFYNALSYSSDNLVTQKNKLNPSFVLKKGTQENLIHYILHCRRVLTIHEGLRWFDIKRYGIEIRRFSDKKVYDILKINDKRKAIQLPKDVISSGLTPNPR